MDDLFLCIKSDYEELKRRIVGGVKAQLESTDLEFTGVSFYNFSSDERDERGDYFTGRTFPSDVKFECSHFRLIKFVDCVFKGSAAFGSAEFEDYAFVPPPVPAFVNCTFEGPAVFRGARFIRGGGGFDNVRFMRGADFSAVDFQYGHSSYAEPESCTRKDYATLFHNVLSPEPLVFEGAKGLWGISSNSAQVVDAIKNAPFAQMPPYREGLRFEGLDAAVGALLLALEEREASCADEVVFLQQEECVRQGCEVPLRRLDRATVEARLKRYFGSLKEGAYHVYFFGPRTLRLIGFGRGAYGVYGVGLSLFRGEGNEIFTLGQTDF